MKRPLPATPGEKFPVADEQFRASIGDTQDSLALAGAEGRLFLCDYEALAGVKNGNFPAGPKYCFAPLALFALPRGGSGARRPRPVAIQCGQNPRKHPVFTPADGEAWKRAKVVVPTTTTTSTTFQKKLDDLEALITERNHTRYGP